MFRSRPSLSLKDTINRILATLSSSDRIEDRKNAILSLKSILKSSQTDDTKMVLKGDEFAIFEVVKQAFLRGDASFDESENCKALLIILSTLLVNDPNHIFAELLVNDSRFTDVLFGLISREFNNFIISVLMELSKFPKMIKLLESSPQISTLINDLDLRTHNDEIYYVDLCNFWILIFKSSNNLQSRVMFEGGLDKLLLTNGGKANGLDLNGYNSPIVLETVNAMLNFNYQVQKQVFSNYTPFIKGILSSQQQKKFIRQFIDLVVGQLVSCPATHLISPLCSHLYIEGFAPWDSYPLINFLKNHSECREEFGRVSIQREKYRESFVNLLLERIITANKEVTLEIQILREWLINNNHQGQIAFLSILMAPTINNSDFLQTLKWELGEFGKPKCNLLKISTIISLFSFSIYGNSDARRVLLSTAGDVVLVEEIFLFLLSIDIEKMSIESPSDFEQIGSSLIEFLLILCYDYTGEKREYGKRVRPLFNFC